MTSSSSTRRSRLPLVLVALAIVALSWWQTRQHESAPAPTGRSTAQEAPRDQAAPAPPTVAGESTGNAPYDLAKDERRGGHTLARHVGRTDDELADRLRREPDISAASTYTDRAAAERTIARTLAREQPRIAKWLARDGNRPNLALDYRGPSGEIIGRSLERRARNATVPCTDAVVVLRWDGQQGYYVLTSYPETRR